MKTSRLLILGLFVTTSNAAVVQTPGNVAVSGIINGDGSDLSLNGDTLDFLKFEILTTSNLSLQSEFFTERQFWLASFAGNDVGFDYIDKGGGLGDIDENDFWVPPGSTVTFNLIPGIYVLATGIRNDPQRDNQFYSTDMGFVPVNPLGGGFTFGTYAYSLSGDIRALEYWDGELNNTFIITTFEVPEPTVPLLAAASAATLLLRRHRD